MKFILNPRTIKSILFPFLLFAAITAVAAQPVRGVWVNRDRTDSHSVPVSNVHRYTKRGSSLSPRSPVADKSASKKALKLTKKSRGQINDFKPETPRDAAPVPTPASITPSPHKLYLPTTIDSYSSDIPSDAPSLVPTIARKKPAVSPNDDGHGNITAPPNWISDNSSRHFDIAPSDHRMLSRDAARTKMPTNPPSIRMTSNSPTTARSSNAPTVLDSSMPTEMQSGEGVSSADTDSAIYLPPPTYILICLALAVTGMATYYENKLRTRQHRGSPEADEGQFVNNNN